MLISSCCVCLPGRLGPEGISDAELCLKNDQIEGPDEGNVMQTLLDKFSAAEDVTEPQSSEYMIRPNWYSEILFLGICCMKYKKI